MLRSSLFISLFGLNERKNTKNVSYLALVPDLLAIMALSLFISKLRRKEP